MRAAHAAALPDVADADVVGSAYCIRDYRRRRRTSGATRASPSPGTALAAPGRAAGARLRAEPRGARPPLGDASTPSASSPAPRTTSRATRPASSQSAGGVFACGRDPYFPAWPEVVQLDASRAGRCGRPRRRPSHAIAERCDGVRCDMAMLVLDDVFVRTWGDRASGGPSPDGGRGLLADRDRSGAAAPPRLRVLGRGVLGPRAGAGRRRASTPATTSASTTGSCTASDAGAVRAHLGADPGWQRHTVRFVENHDEPRAAAVLDAAADRAAAVVALTLPGVALLHEGQADGRRVRVPVTLGRRPGRAPDRELRAWYDRFLAALAGGLRRGRVGLGAGRGLARQRLVRAPGGVDVDRARPAATSWS